jgi:nitroreductase
MSQQPPREPTHPIDPLFLRRWSPRAFDGSTISEAELLTLLEAARWAPSGFNLQPWRFLYGRRDTPAWGLIHDALVPFNQAWAQNASALVAVASRTHTQPTDGSAPQPIRSTAFDAGAAWASLAFQSVLSGWSSHAVGGFDADKLRANLGVPESHVLHAVIVIGKPGDKAALPEALQAREQPSPRRPLAEIAGEGRFAFAD